MKLLHLDDTVISIPLPLFVQVEDVGWWQGEDGSGAQQPYRNRFGRNHCLEDYEALFWLAEKLSMRIALGMVIGEWDRSDHLKTVPGATWMGKLWNNSANRGPLLDQTASFLNEHQEHLEIALHGLCHEFWRNGLMQRSEFHTEDGNMRTPEIVRQHLQAFMHLLGENGIESRPRLFIPPALNHSFGNGAESMQSLLAKHGIQYVITRFSRARQHSPPHHPEITWEENVVLLERGEAPVSWDQTAAAALKIISPQVVPLHWSNLLHPDPAGNKDIVDRWAQILVKRAEEMDCILAADVAHCFRQAAVYHLAEMQKSDNGVEIDLQILPKIPQLRGSFSIKIHQHSTNTWLCKGGKINKMPPGRSGEYQIIPDVQAGKVLLYQNI